MREIAQKAQKWTEKTVHSALPSCSNFQKRDFSVAHEKYFRGLTQHLWLKPLWF